MHFTAYIVAAIATASTALAHMEMVHPYPLRSQFDPKNDWSNIDYDNTSPLEPNGKSHQSPRLIPYPLRGSRAGPNNGFQYTGSNFPCRGHHKNTAWRTVANYTAGQSDSMKLAPGNNHHGGSCQISLSYDNGETFRVIESYMGGCPLKLEWDFEIPSFAPSGQALFAWSWFNIEGNREMYMNCAQVEIEGGSGSATEFDQLPEIFTANIGNGCSTVEGKETVFAHPGDSVGYAGKVSPGDAPFPKCGGNA
ncbi:endoglucanase [Aspergillus bombycis]|uniref:Endoglucanase n=1 Tax=Aspergillus bombycis TaxID=109264 RepID=A0A1F8ADG2_9EURO|nr:endoglucanase [Aspergillus bombycis]OGM49722.1 endoglucanase [Aspergillus bombycis]